MDAGGNVSITANGNFSLTGIAGSIGVGGTTGAGAANTTLLHDDEVHAWLGTSAQVTTLGPTGLTLKATSTDDIIGVSAAGTGGGTNALAGAATVLVLNESTKAQVKTGAQITADNGLNAGTPGIEVSAADTTNIVTIAGNLAVAGTTGVWRWVPISPL